MRRVVSALLLSLAVTACNAVGEGPPCAAPEAYPVCTSARTGVLTCEDGEEVVVPCAAEGEACLDLVDAASGARLSECLPLESIPCDPAAFLPYCVDSGVVVACVAPATYPTAGHSEGVPCGEGETCRLDGDRGACLPEPEPPDPEACDAVTFPGACREASPVACVEERLVAQEPCVPPLVCQVGPLGAVCTAGGATACNPALAPPACDGAAVAGCDPETGFTFHQACPEGQTCRLTPEGPICSTEPGTCDPLLFVPRCATPTTRIVCTPLGHEVTETCAGMRECRVGANGAFCVPPSAEPCDPATFVPTCSPQLIVTCNAVTAFTERQSCGRMMRCVVDPEGGAACVP